MPKISQTEMSRLVENVTQIGKHSAVLGPALFEACQFCNSAGWGTGVWIACDGAGFTNTMHAGSTIKAPNNACQK